jgi:carbonic anhydrase
MRFVGVAVVVLGLAGVAAAQTSTWEYEGKHGALAWGKNPANRACSQGHQQSPIDVRGARLSKGLQPIEFHYIAGPVTLENNGHTIVAHFDPGSSIVAGGVRYQLEWMEFHHPSEDAVKGKLVEFEVELVHKSADGKQAVVALRLKEDPGNPNAVLATLWPHLPKTAGATERVTDEVDAGGFLPADRGYWTYPGSITSPPCSEGVSWFLFQDELTLSRDQLRAFTAIFKLNSRPLQDLHGRRIAASE